MKKLISFWHHQQFFTLLILAMLSVLFGGAGFSMAEGVTPPPVDDPAAGDKTDPVNPETNDLNSPDGNGAGQQLAGTQASATQARRGDLAETEYDPDVVKYKAAKYVLLNHARTVATQRTVKGYEVAHFRIGEESLILNVVQDIPAGDVITLDSEHVQGNLGLLGTSSTLIVKGVDGYEPGSSTKTDGGDLQLFVISNDEDVVKCRPINGKAKVNGQVTDYLRDMTAPAIPAGTELLVTAPACSESQMIVPPDNTQPRPETVYLKKSAFNIILTDHQREILKKTPWGFKDIKETALANFSKKMEYDLWLSQQRRFIVRVGGTNAEEYAYTCRGILRQLTNTLGIDGAFQWKHIVAIGKIQFTNFSENNEAYAYCGKNKIAEIATMDQVLHHDTEYKHRVTDYGVVVRDLVSNFGTLHIVHAPALDDYGYSDFMVVVDMENARYYHKVMLKDKTNDLKNNGDEAREASIYMYLETFALALRGYNSLLVGPSDKIAKRNVSTSANPVNLVDALPENPYDGMIITFDTPLKDGETELDPEKVYWYKDGSWQVYTGNVE